MSHANRHFALVGNADGSNVHAVTYHRESEQSILCDGYGDKKTRLGRNVVVKDVGCYEDVAKWHGKALCTTCRRVAGSIAATERAFAVRAGLVSAAKAGRGITLSQDQLLAVLQGLAPWEAKGLHSNPAGEPLLSED